MTDHFPQIPLGIKSPSHSSSGGTRRGQFRHMSHSRLCQDGSARPGGPQHHSCPLRAAKLSWINDIFAKQKELQGSQGGSAGPGCSAAGFLGLCQDSAGWSCRTFPGQRPLSSQRSLQLQGVHVFLHPLGIRVSTDLPVLPGDEPVKSGREVLQPRRGKRT